MNDSVTFPESWFSKDNPYRILVVDPNAGVQKRVRKALGDIVMVERAWTGDTALQMLGLAAFDLLLLQLNLPIFSGIELARRLKKLRPDLAVLPFAESTDDAELLELQRLGYPLPVLLPDGMEELLEYCRENMVGEEWRLRFEWLQDRLRRKFKFDRILSLQPVLWQVQERLTRVVNSRVPVMITGESGTGKELVARMIHTCGDGSRSPFISVNCAAVPEGLLESQFFGHEKGAFTGAVSRMPGKFELADGGTLFLDEIGEMSPALQSKLLRILEHGEFERVGGSETIRVNVRLITATNRDLEAEVTKGTFRTDLYYRINVFPVHLPPLRERGDDIILLAYYFLLKSGPKNNRQARYIHPEALGLLREYPWPGNIRELENVIERALLLSDGVLISPDDLPRQLEWRRIRTAPESAAADSELEPVPPVAIESAKSIPAPDGRDPADITPLKELERSAIVNALETTGGNIAQASRCLGISRNTLYRKIEEHDLTLPKGENHRDETPVNPDRADLESSAEKD